MNGIKYIREKSNISKNALAERMGVTRQTISLWENGSRKPSKTHLQWLCTFYSLEPKWFNEIDDQAISELNKMKMYAHDIGGKEYYTFKPESDNGTWQLHFTCGDQEAMLDNKFLLVSKRGKELMKRVEHYLYPRYDWSICDKIVTAERGCAEIERYLDLMECVHKIGKNGRYLKVPFRYEIIAVLYAMMVASGQYTIEEIKDSHYVYFDPEMGGLYIDSDYVKNLVDLMSEHWNQVKEYQDENYHRAMYRH